MPEELPLVGDGVWTEDLGNCVIQSIDEDEDEILVEVLSWGKGQDGEVHSFDYWTVASSWSDRFGGMYFPDGMFTPRKTAQPFDLTVASSIMELQSGIGMGKEHGDVQQTTTE